MARRLPSTTCFLNNLYKLIHLKLTNFFLRDQNKKNKIGSDWIGKHQSHSILSSRSTWKFEPDQ